MRRKLLFFLALAGLIAATYLFVPEEFDSQLFWASFRRADAVWVSAAIAATALGYLVRALRWQSLLFPLSQVDLVPLVNAHVIGFGAIFTLGRAGEVVRPLWISRQEGVPFIGAAASIVVERVFDLMVLVVLFVLGSAWIDLPEATRDALGGFGTPWPLVVFVVVALAGFVLAHKYAGPLARLSPFGFLRKIMETVSWGLAATSTARGFSVVTLYSLILWIVYALQFWFMLEALDLRFPIAASVLTLVFTSLGSIIQIPGIGGGFQAGFILSATVLLDLPPEVAIAASLMVWFITAVPTVVAAAGYMMWKGVSVRDLGMQKAALSIEKP